MKKKYKIAVGILCVASILAFLFWWGGDSEELHGFSSPVTNELIYGENNPSVNSDVELSEPHKDKETVTVVIQEPEADSVVVDSFPEVVEYEDAEIEKPMELSPETDSVTEFSGEEPQLVEEETVVQPDEPTQLFCTLSVRCDTALKYDVAEFLPTDGVIYAEKTVEFFEGESVFNVLVREMKQGGVHLEFVNVPVYNSAYIEGISNLYEFDCGELSGWMYRVNGIYPQFGCSQYILCPGDKIEWLYTCNSGDDIGGSNFSGNGMKRDEF